MIKKYFFIFVLFLNFLYASSIAEIKQFYENKDYAKVCTLSAAQYTQNKNNEEFLNIFASSCLKSDMVNRLMLPIIKLYKTKQARENASYFATIFYQKKMLYYALCDNIDISYINLPSTNYILSKIFEKFVQGKYELKNSSYWFDSNDTNIRYKLSIEKRANIKKMYLRTYKNNKIIKVRVYW